ncbi:MAG: NUDIX hydrolase [Micromonosporaceae bacterium]
MAANGDAGHEVLAVVLQVRDGVLAGLLWQRGMPPYQGKWALPGGALGASEDLGPSVRRQLAAKVDVRELSHLEQLDTRGAVDRHPGRRVIATGYLGLVPADADPCVPPDTAWHPVDESPELAYDHAAIVRAGRNRLRSKLSYTNLGFALAPPEFTISQLRGYYAAALGYEVSATNLQRVLLRRGQIEATGRTAPPGPHGGRPAELFRFRARRLEITDGFAVLRPPRT